MQFQSNSCTLACQSGIQMIISLVACRLFHRTQARLVQSKKAVFNSIVAPCNISMLL